MRYSIYVKPGSKKAPLIETDADGSLTVYVKERAADGKANQAVIESLARHFNVAKTQVEIIRGHASRNKLIEIY